MKKIILHSNQLGLRGTEVALFSYAEGNEDILGNESYIAAPKNCDLRSWPKFVERFGDRVYLYNKFSDLQVLVDDEKIDVVYQIISGQDTSLKLQNTKNVYHAVFNHRNPEITAYVSEWLAEQHPGSQFVPHIVTLPEVTEDYRPFLSMPDDVVVIGRYGGFDQLDISYIPSIIEYVVNQNPKMYFLLMNTASLGFNHPRVIYLDATTDLHEKAGFLNTLDAFITGRTDGESFGLSIAEACLYNLPVITNSDGRDKNHMKILGPHGFYYESANELAAILMNFKRNNFDYRQLVKQYEPHTVMLKFKEVFLS